MAKKEKQHFIPQCYLKNFAKKIGEETFIVSACLKEGSSEIKEISVADICAESHLYTMKHLDGDAKYAIEDFYAEAIESNYPSVYKLLIDKNVTTITLEQRALILKTILSLYFRTPKLLNQYNRFCKKLFHDLREAGEVNKINFLGMDIDLHSENFKEILKGLEENNRLNFITTGLSLFNEFYKFKFNDGFMVIELVGDGEFITSDNPVAINDINDSNFNLFNSNNSIYAPLDSKHCLFIAPRTEEGGANYIFRKRTESIQEVSLNYKVSKNAERWIIGSESGLKRHLIKQEEFSKPASENHPMIVDMKNKLAIVGKLYSCMEKGGISNDNKDLMECVEELKKSKFINTLEFQDTYKQLKELGLNI